ncbi:unnamed protein product [Tuber aestivum]|uniref:Helitron helicase-like domain-containing protein n=1 Tax=Tuber aestivum TaxID=59557 RepID=A0A292Q5H6_9PEZI|nr:unnamed protein product [Tuber aestivum]
MYSRQMNQVEEFRQQDSQNQHRHNHLESYSNRGIVLPVSFLGFRAWAASEVADSLALCRSKRKPSFFITITTNPNWPEIQQKLAPGQTALDIPVIVCRLYENILARLYTLFEWLNFKNEVFLMPILWLRYTHPELPFEKVDQLISAQMPDPNTDPELHHIITRFNCHPTMHLSISYSRCNCNGSYV